ncbi:MAG: SDR family oxidoreductase [Actinomycetia bacterium]|nr:SDR family oxidoreductase [Actinomycetes bacterium]MCP4227153.1 SDR family oxidoreductase [Actinomycetes bacterium]MCP5035563.1 SDR family oxidoreductase [Actinomycetes bacterium]
MTGRLAGKTALITGGSNGIGRACAERFSDEGASIMIADLLPEPGAVAVDAINAAGGKAAYVELEAASEEANEAMAAATVEVFGSIDVVVTAAGISNGDYRSGDLEGGLKRMAQAAEATANNPAAPLTELDLDDWRRVLDVNLTGTLLAIRATAPIMLDQGTGGSIVTIASIAARDPLWGTPSYPVSKAGVWMLTKNAARTLAPLGIRVNSIGPGFIDTNMTAILDEVDEYHSLIIGRTPMGRKGKPHEIASVALFLASDDASYVTGELIHPDGGWFTG